MPYKYKNHIKRRKTIQINVGNVAIGHESPISVQSMTNTITSDIDATLNQIHQIHEAGADIVRVSCPDEKSTKALKKIVNDSYIPIVADIHFHYKRAVEAATSGASCLRINPGNIGNIKKIKEVVSAARDNNCSIRIGVNSGSLEKNILEKYKNPCPEAMVESALKNINILESLNFENIKISVKSSNVFFTILAYKELAKKCSYPLHLGVTESGTLNSGTVKSTLGIGSLLYEGIGDTIRVSLSADPVEEVRVGREILKSLGLLKYGVSIISCPSCARQQFDVIKTSCELEKRLSHIKKPIVLSIIGCVVNGPGESLVSDIGIAGGSKKHHQVYINGAKAYRTNGESIVEEVVKIVERREKEMKEV